MPMDLSTEALLATPEVEIPSALRGALVVLAAPTLQKHANVGRFVDPTRSDDGYFDWD